MFAEIENNKYYQLIVLLSTEFPSIEKEQKTQDLLTRININELYECSCKQEMETIIYPNLKLYYQGKLPDFWEKRYEETKSRITFMLSKLKEVSLMLSEKDIPLVALKNGGIASAIIEDPAKSPMGDIDTLVNKDDFLEAHQTLIDMGFEFEFRSEHELEDLDQAFIDGGTEYYFTDHEGNEMWFELSWRPISGRWIRLDKEPDAKMMINNSILVDDTKVRILAPEDNLLQVAIHTAKHSYVRDPGFRLHLDVERIVKHSEINWKVFQKKVELVGTKTAVYYSLYIAARLFDTPIPQTLLIELKPGWLKNWYITRTLKKAELLHPTAQKFSKVGFVLFQIMLYDNVIDIYKVIIPSSKWLKEKYKYKSSLLTPWYMFVRFLDLIGFRKSKAEG